MECDVCRKTFEETFGCDGCGKRLCRQDIDITPTEVKCLQLKGKRTLKFYCEKCLKCETFMLFHSVIEGKTETIQSKNKIIELLEGDVGVLRAKVAELEQKLKEVGSQGQLLTDGTLTQRSYASIVKDSVVVVKPVLGKDSEKTREIVKQKFKPEELGVGISGVKKGRDGAVVIKCRNRDEAGQVMETIQKNLGNEYRSHIPAKKNPRIKITHIDAGFDEQSLLEAIKCQNKSVIDESSAVDIRVFKKCVPSILLFWNVIPLLTAE